MQFPVMTSKLLRMPESEVGTSQFSQNFTFIKAINSKVFIFKFLKYLISGFNNDVSFVSVRFGNFSDVKSKMSQEAGESALKAYTSALFDESISWKDVKWLKT